MSSNKPVQTAGVTSRRIPIKAKPGAKIAKITEKEGQFIVAVKERAIDGKANRAIEKALAKHFGIASSCVRVVTGHATREKIVEIG